MNGNVGLIIFTKNDERKVAMEENRTYFIDCIDGIRQLKDKSVALVVTSPPYAMQRKSYYGGVYPKGTTPNGL